MKKTTSKIIAILLSLTLVFSMSGVAFADANVSTAENSTAKTTESKMVSDEAIGTGSADVLKNKADGKITVKSVAEDRITVTPTKVVTLTSTTTMPYSYVTLPVDSYMIAEITPKSSGWMWFDFEASGIDPTDTVTYEMIDNIQYDAEGNLAYWDIYSMNYVAPGETLTDMDGVYVTANETYYFLIFAGVHGFDENNEEYMISNDQEMDAGICAKIYSNVNNRMLYSYADANKYTIASGVNKAGTGTSDLYFKVKPSKTGVMTVDLKAYSGAATVGTITLYSANKVKVSNAVKYQSNKAATRAYFGVTKGKTYYIRVQNCGDVKGYFYAKYGIKYNMTINTDRDINTKAKAKKLVKGGSGYKTLFTANNATGIDYYKLYVSSKKKTQFTVDTTKIRSGNIKVQVYKNGKQVGATKTIYPTATKTTFTITYGTTSGKASAGTYYIKLTKGQKASGQYQIKYTK